MYQAIIVIHVLLALGIIGLIMIQQGKGADAGASFGTGASSSVFGSQGAGSFLTRTTAILATLFFTTSLGLAVIGGNQVDGKDIMAEQPAKPASSVPVIPGVELGQPVEALPKIPGAAQSAPAQDSVSQQAETANANTPKGTEKK